VASGFDRVAKYCPMVGHSVGGAVD